MNKSKFFLFDHIDKIVKNCKKKCAEVVGENDKKCQYSKRLKAVKSFGNCQHMSTICRKM